MKITYRIEEIGGFPYRAPVAKGNLRDPEWRHPYDKGFEASLAANTPAPKGPAKAKPVKSRPNLVLVKE